MIKKIIVDYRFFSKVQGSALSILNLNSKSLKKKIIFKNFEVIVKLKISNKRNLSKYVTLRAPKHFKVGRHPYQSCKRKILINVQIIPRVQKSTILFYKIKDFSKFIHIFYKFFSNKLLYIPLSTLTSVNYKTSFIYSLKDKIKFFVLFYKPLLFSNVKTASCFFKS